MIVSEEEKAKKVKLAKLAKQAKRKAASEALPEDQRKPKLPDWDCAQCCNHNYSFREYCNKCGLSQVEHHQIVAQNQMEDQFDYGYYPESYDFQS